MCSCTGLLLWYGGIHLGMHLVLVFYCLTGWLSLGWRLSTTQFGLVFQLGFQAESKYGKGFRLVLSCLRSWMIVRVAYMDDMLFFIQR